MIYYSEVKMAGTYYYAKNRKELVKKLSRETPYGSKVRISRAPSLDKRSPKGKKAYYVLVDVYNKRGKKLLWHN